MIAASRHRGPAREFGPESFGTTTTLAAPDAGADVREDVILIARLDHIAQDAVHRTADRPLARLLVLWWEALPGHRRSVGTPRAISTPVIAQRIKALPLCAPGRWVRKVEVASPAAPARLSKDATLAAGRALSGGLTARRSTLHLWPILRLHRKPANPRATQRIARCP